MRRKGRIRKRRGGGAASGGGWRGWKEVKRKVLENRVIAKAGRDKGGGAILSCGYDARKELGYSWRKEGG